MKTYLDLEADFSFKHDLKGKQYSDFANPYNDGNKLAILGTVRKGKYTEHYGLPDIPEGDTIVGHNIKYDAKWLACLGLDTTKYKYEDTLLREFVAGCGTLRANQCGLAKCVKRRFGGVKPDLCAMMWKEGIQNTEIPHNVLRYYQKTDVYNTRKLYWEQEKDPMIEAQRKYLNFAHDVLPVLVRMEHHGLGFNGDISVEMEDYTITSKAGNELKRQRPIIKASGEAAKVMSELQSRIATGRADVWEALEKACGNSYTNVLDSYYDWQEQSKSKTEIVDSGKLWEIIYSLRIKPECAKKFSTFAKRWRPHRRGAQKELDYAINTYCEKLDYGLRVKPSAAWMQLAQVPHNEYIGKTGFKASAKLLDAYLDSGMANKRQANFIKAYLGYKKAKTQYNSNLNSIFKGLRDDGKVHGNFNQTGTVTCRFSSTDPNLQNIPDKRTCNLKHTVNSVHEDGVIIDADYGQLEFRIAGWMSNDTQLIEDVEGGFDIHLHTAKMAFKGKFGEVEYDEDGDIKLTPTQKGFRQQAKAYTFAFQYGAMPKTRMQQAIFDAFYGKYWRLKDWQESVIAEIAGTQQYVCPFTGKIFKFPYAHHGNEATWTTKAKNYPVQYLSGVVTQAAMIEFDRRTQDVDGVDLVIQVHDSLVVDSKRELATWAYDTAVDSMDSVTNIFEEYFGHKITVKLGADATVGKSYYDQAKTIKHEADKAKDGLWWSMDEYKFYDNRK